MWPRWTSFELQKVASGATSGGSSGLNQTTLDDFFFLFSFDWKWHRSDNVLYIHIRKRQSTDRTGVGILLHNPIRHVTP